MKHLLLKISIILAAFLPGADSVQAQILPQNSDTTMIISSGEVEIKGKGKKVEKTEDSGFFDFSLERFDSVFFMRLGINLLSMLILVRFIYYPVYRTRDYFFMFFMFNLTIFIVTYLLNAKSSFSTGAAFGLFAIFSMLRYRTEDISARDMTYLFTVITLGLISSVNKGNIFEIVMINSIIVLAAYLLDGGIIIKTELMKVVQYEKIELIRPENHTELIEDLRSRTGLNIHKISVDRVDFLRDTALIKVYYYNKKGSNA